MSFHFPFFEPLAAMNISQPGVPAYSPCVLKWLLRRDSNPRPSAYEADEITASTTPHYYGAPGWIRTCTLRFLRPFPLPVGIQEQFGDPRETRTRTCRIKSPVSYQLDERIIWSSQSDLNRQSSAYKAAALPLCYRSILVIPARLELASPGLRVRYLTN